jgi:hydrogenase maturation protease
VARTKKLLVVGLGSPHGDDRIGWLIIERLRLRPDYRERCLALSTPLDLMDHLGAVDRLVIVDALKSDQPVGTVTRRDWPEVSVEGAVARSSHGLGAMEALRLAESLGILPDAVMLIGVEIGSAEPGSTMQPILLNRLDSFVNAVADAIESPPRG